MKKASVIVPAYNVAYYIEETLQSAIKQTFPKNKYEIVVVDDGSTDGTGEIVKKTIFSNTNTNFKFYRQGNKGISNARNKALDMAEGDYNIQLDSDDLFVPKTIERCVDELDKGFDFVYSDHLEITKSGKKIIGKREKGDLHPHLSEAVYFIHFIGHVRAFKKSDIRYKENLKLSEDLDFHIQFLEQNKKIGHIPEILYYYIARDFNVEKDREREIAYYHILSILPHLKKQHNSNDVDSVLTSKNGISWHEPVVNGKRIPLRDDLINKWVAFCTQK